MGRVAARTLTEDEKRERRRLLGELRRLRTADVMRRRVDAYLRLRSLGVTFQEIAEAADVSRAAIIQKVQQQADQPAADAS